MYEKIKEWLEKGRDYSEGLDLFNKASKNRALYNYLSRKQDMVKLVYELEKLLKVLPKSEPVEVKEPVKDQTHEKDVKTVQLTHIREGVKREYLPEDLQQVYDDVTETYKLQRAAHERMKLEELTDEQRAETRAVVVSLDNVIVAGWEKIDAYLAGEKVKGADEKKETPPAPAKDPLLIAKEVNAARKFISTNLDKVATSKDTVKEVLVTKLRERYTTLLNLKAEVDPETIDKLIKAGVISKT